MKIAIVVALFNSEITFKLLEGTRQRLLEQGVAEKDISIVEVPGAVEIPLTAKLLAATKKYQAIICLGAIIRGDTDHYHYVCQQVSNGCQQVMMEFNLPVIFGVLTTDNEEQAFARTQGGMNKGVEAANTAIHMINLLATI